MRILLVEDDPMIGKTLQQALAQDGYAVDWVTDGAAGKSAIGAAQDAYAMVLLDLGLPRKSGLELLRELRRSGNRVRVLVVTARDAVADRVDGLNSGADDYLIKPFAFEELVARLRALLRRGDALKPSVIVVGDLEVDTLALTVSRGGQAIPLTSREYALLEYFARNAGRTISREDITAHVWDENHDPASNALDVLVSRLRRKIDPLNGDTIIQTRRGLGYTLVLATEPSSGTGHPRD